MPAPTQDFPDEMTNQTTVSPDPVPDPRKYVSPSTTEAFPNAAGVSNVESIVQVASGLSSAARAVEAIAKTALAEAAAARVSINNLANSPTTTTNTSPQITQDDVIQQQTRIGNISQNNLSTTSSPSVNSNLINVMNTMITETVQQFMPPIDMSDLTNYQNKVIPEITSIALELKNGKGVGDSFFSRTTFSIPVSDIDQKNIASVRIFRAEIISPTLSRPIVDLSFKGLDVITDKRRTNRSKNDDRLSMLERRLNKDGIRNQMTELNPLDRFVGQRITTDFSVNIDTEGIDPAVSENLKFNDSLRLQNQNYNLYQYDDVITAGAASSGSQDLSAAHSDELSSRTSDIRMPVQDSNQLGFKQIFVSTPSKMQAKRIGSRYYFFYDDESIVFGRQYKYYVTTVNKYMVQSNRSSIVTLTVDGLRVPASPKHVVMSSDGFSATLFMTVDDQFVEKFEIWKKSYQPSAAQKEFYVTTNSNGFSMVDEAVNSEHKTGANWIDRKVIPGHKYTYRIYSVDVFGNKSESPFESTIIIPEDSPDVDKTLGVPSILAEVDSKTQKIVVTLRCDDKNVKKLLLERRDLTIGQENFVSPSQSGRIIMSKRTYKHGSYVYGERVQDEDNISMWNGWIDNTSGDIKFVDRLTSFDRTYQYRVHGMDARGHKTSYDYSDTVLVHRKPMINVPVNLSASIVTGSAGEVNGVNISWQSSSLDVSAEDMLGSQRKLANTSVRTLYQLERQKAGEKWLSFNMTSNSSYFDPVNGYSGVMTPEFRPPFLDLNSTYNYRVQAVMSGGFISNTAPQISVFVGNLVSTPTNFFIRSPDPHLRPFYAMLNWDTPADSGVVDHWDIARCEVNNFAADRINIANPESIKNLNFTEFRTVYSESSRFRSIWGDWIFKAAFGSLMTGQHHFLDAQVVFGNSYFYRLTAVDPRGNRSASIYRGIKLTYTPYERIYAETFTADEINRLTNNFVPVRPVFAITADPALSTMSINPTFSTPKSSPPLRPTTSKRYNES